MFLFTMANKYVYRSNDDRSSSSICDFCDNSCTNPITTICSQCLSNIFPFSNCTIPSRDQIVDQSLCIDDFDFCNVTKCRMLAHEELLNFLSVMPRTEQITLCHFNVRSLQKNIDHLAEIIHSLDSLPSFIAISETRLKSDPLVNIELEGYRFLHTPTVFNAGGVGVYYNENLKTQLLPSLNIDFHECEQLWVKLYDILPNGRPIVIGTLYRHSQSNANEFLKQLEIRLLDIAEAHMNCVILGDLNINLLAISSFKSRYLNVMKSLGFIPTITIPTRYTNTSATLLDHIYVNMSSFTINPIVGLYDISDHLPVFVQILAKSPQATNLTHASRSLHSVKYEQVHEESQSLFPPESRPVLTNTNFNACFNDFTDMITSIVHKFAPERPLTLRLKI